MSRPGCAISDQGRTPSTIRVNPKKEKFMPYFMSSTFSFVLKNKGLDDLESINEAAKRLLKSGDLILVKRGRRFFYIQHSELRIDDIILNQHQQEQSELHNDVTVNYTDKLSNGNNTNNQQVNLRA
jgi:hypothetical protein